MHEPDPEPIFPVYRQPGTDRRTLHRQQRMRISHPTPVEFYASTTSPSPGAKNKLASSPCWRV